MEKPKMSPKDFFLYFGTALTLYASAGALLAFLFDIINAALPDALSAQGVSSWATSGMRFSLSTLLVAFPLYLILTWLIRKDIMRDIAKYQLSVRKWFIYFTLFVAGATIAGDIIALVNTYLGGEISARFLWKMLSVLFFAGVVFWYYIYDLRRAGRGDTTLNKIPLVASIVGVLAIIVVGFIVGGTPSDVRALRFDETRISNLQDIQWQVTSYYQNHAVLPETLDALSNDISGYRAPLDPETNASYEYKKTGTLSFQLCATFARDAQDSASPVSRPYPDSGVSSTFAHQAGHVCFDRTIDPAAYPVLKK
jgi:hypothetical protein